MLTQTHSTTYILRRGVEGVQHVWGIYKFSAWAHGKKERRTAIFKRRTALKQVGKRTSQLSQTSKRQKTQDGFCQGWTWENNKHPEWERLYRRKSTCADCLISMICKSQKLFIFLNSKKWLQLRNFLFRPMILVLFTTLTLLPHVLNKNF